MLSNLESLFYQDIELWDWESALENIDPWTDRVPRAKQSTWNIIRSHDEYYEVDNVSNVYATMLCMQLESAIEELLPKSSITFDRNINSLHTSLTAIVNDEEVDIADLGDVVELIKIASGYETYAFILDEIGDCEFTDLDNPENIIRHGIIRELYYSNVASVISSQEVATEIASTLEQGVPGILWGNGKLFCGIENTAKSAIAVGRLITDYFADTSSKISMTDGAVSLEVIINDEPYSINCLDSFWEAWHAAEAVKC